MAVELTGSRVHDSQQLPSLLEQISDPIRQVSGDGAYDTRACYEAVLQRGATPTFVPRCTAQPSTTQEATGWRAARNHLLLQIAAQGCTAWRVLSGYTRQSVAEAAMFRCKRVFGAAVGADRAACGSTDQMLCAQSYAQLGMPANACRMSKGQGRTIVMCWVCNIVPPTLKSSRRRVTMPGRGSPGEG